MDVFHKRLGRHQAPPSERKSHNPTYAGILEELAHFVNFTVTEPQTGGWLAAYPTRATLPLVSNLNFVGGQTVPNLATVGLTNAQATLFNGSWGSVQMVADVFAYIL
jgi:hypothetical protein